MSLANLFLFYLGLALASLRFQLRQLISEQVSPVFFSNVISHGRSKDNEGRVGKVMSDQMVALTVKVDEIINNRNNRNKGGEPIMVHDGNNRIIEDSSSSKVEKTDIYEIMSNH